jgi:hypothetical protein
MKGEKSKTDFALVKRSASLGIKISAYVLAPLCILFWLVAFVPIVYKSASLGMSPLEFIRAPDSLLPRNSPTHLSKIVGGLIASVELVIVGIVSSALFAALIGVNAAGIKALRCRGNRSFD